MIDSNDSNGIDAYRQRLSQALDTAEYSQDPDRQGAAPQSIDAQEQPSMQGAGPQVDDRDQDSPPLTPPSGQGPTIGPAPELDPASAQSAPMIAGQGAGQGAGPIGGGSDYGASTPTLDTYMPSAVQGLAPTAPTAPMAPTAPTAATAPLAATAASAPSAPTAGQAPQAPTIDGARAPAVGDAAGQAPAAPAKDPAQTGPKGFAPKYDPAMLSAANTHGDIFAAMDPKSQTQYMDWWQKEHGAVDARYAQLKKELGTRPDPERDPTRREKFQTLMDFGMNLLKNSGRGQDPVRATGEALTEATANQRGRQQAQTNTYDAKSASIERSRQADQKDLGNYGQAVREDALITDARTRTSLALAKSMQPPKPGTPMTRLLSNDTQVQWNPAPTRENPQAGSWDLSRDAQGKPLPKMLEQGPRGGLARGSNGSSVPHTRIDSDGTLTIYNAKTGQFDPALNSATHQPIKAPQKTGDPGKDFLSMYGKVYNKQYDNADEANQIAQDYVDRNYGPGAIDRQRNSRAPTTSTGAPPASMLKEGKAQKFKDGSTWTLRNGVAARVQ